jgi:HEAT repeat protein
MIGLLLGILMGCGPSADSIAQNLTSENPVVREDSAKIAHNFDSEEVRAALVESLRDPSTEVRLNALNSLISLEATESVPAVMAMLEVESAREVELLAIDALGRFKDPQSVPLLMEYIENCRAESDRSIPFNAIWALGFIGDHRALALLSELHQSSDTYIAWNASQALSELMPPSE